MKPSVPKAVPNAVAFSADNSVKVNKEAQRGPYQPMKGSSINPVVPKTEIDGETPQQPYFTGGYGAGPQHFIAGIEGAPSDGFLFKKGPIDVHYQDPEETRDPYATVGRPGTYGWNTRIQQFMNHVAHNQMTTETGFKVNTAQQRTSYMRNQLPPVGAFGTQTFQPAQQPQAVRYNRIIPTTGTDKYGTGVLNNDTLGAGQTYGGQGGSNYTPPPGPPPTNSITTAPMSAEPTWG
jgi:hypothetical protein